MDRVKSYVKDSEATEKNQEQPWYIGCKAYDTWYPYVNKKRNKKLNSYQKRLEKYEQLTRFVFCTETFEEKSIKIW